MSQNEERVDNPPSPEQNPGGKSPDLSVVESTPPGRTYRFARRGSSIVKMLSEEPDAEEVPIRRASTPEKRIFRKGSSTLKLLDDQDFNRRFSAPEKLRTRRGSSVVRLLSEEQQEIDFSSRRSSRSGSIVKMTSEENFADDEGSRRSSRASDYAETTLEKRKSIRRGSSFIKMLSDDQSDDRSSRSESERSDASEKFRKAGENGYKHSLESISEYKTKIFSSNTIYPSLDSPTLDCLSEFASRTIAESVKEIERTNASWLDNPNNEFYSTPHLSDDNKSGEWNYFWSNYNNSANEYFSSPYLCPSNSAEDLSMDSNCSTTQRDKGGQEKIIFTLDEVNEALHCAQRVTDILKDALRRSEENEYQNSSSKEETSQANSTPKKNVEKPASSNSCIDVILNHTGVADILKKVLNKRHEVLMPAEETRRNSSGWTSFDSLKK